MTADPEAMEKLNGLLPGIEEFLVQILSQEKLSSVAEERRRYFVERLDILKLPPSLPPRAGKRLSVELLEKSEETCGIPAELVPELTGLVPDLSSEPDPPLHGDNEPRDFAAEQREISRNLLASVSSEKDLDDDEETDSTKEVKVYDDIDASESSRTEEKEDEDEDDVNALYEIPIARQQLQPMSEDSLSQPADVSSLATAGSVDDISDDVLDAPSPGGGQPPPLPPRTLKKESESSENRVSASSLDEKPPELPFRPPLPRRNELYSRSEKSDKSDKSDVSDGDSTSYESFDEIDHDTENMSKHNIKLPKRPKKKTSSRLLSSKARSSSGWEINVPFKKLDSVVLSGEMHYKGKLSWSRRQVAISNSCMAMYKPDKETRPVFVIPLPGFSASISDCLGRKGFELKMIHDNGESHTFAVDFKEWAKVWCEYINNISQGQPVLPYHQHLVRSFSGGSDNSTYGSKMILHLIEDDYEEYATDNSSVFGTPPLTPQILHCEHSDLLTGNKRVLPQNRSCSTLTSSARTASTLTLSRWDWKTLFYNWSFPLDQIILGLRRGNLSNSNSNLSVSSEGIDSDDSSKPRHRANKVMRMGSFAYRATQFFENLGKKTTSKRKTSSLSSPTEAGVHVHDGIQEESSLSSGSIGLQTVSLSSDATSLLFEDGFQFSSAFSSPASSDPPPLPLSPPPPLLVHVKHQGYLNIFSSFNKRRWGKRWCLIRENMFECYRTQTSQPCELSFLLKNCIIQQALAETNSPLAIMVLENNREKITVEPLTKEDLGQWLQVLMEETATEAVPMGLEDFFVEAEDNTVEDLSMTLVAEYSDIVGASVLKSWESCRSPVLSSEDKAVAEFDTDDGADSVRMVSDDTAETDNTSKESNKYLYSEVIKHSSSSTLEQLGEERENIEEGRVVEKEDERVPCFTDNLAVYNANKNTTDSGFYSVKETPSDSDSESEITRNNLSVVQDSSSVIVQEKAALLKCNNSEKGISSSANEEEDESMLEKTMTANNFTECLANGQENVCAESVETGSDKNDVNTEGDSHNVNCEEGISVEESVIEKDGDTTVLTETHSLAERASQGVQKSDKTKKKKKKSKGKKSKHTAPEQENILENNAVNMDKTVSSNSKSHKSPNDNDESEIHVKSSLSEEPINSYSESNSSVKVKQSSNSDQETTTSTVGTDIQEMEKLQGPEEDEVVTELKQRIGQLREKLVQIKRKRIAVRDKRVRAFSAEERAVCDREYLTLESECKETAATIKIWEEELEVVITAKVGQKL